MGIIFESVLPVVYPVYMLSEVVVDALLEVLSGVWDNVIIDVDVLVDLNINIFEPFRCTTPAPEEAFGCRATYSR